MEPSWTLSELVAEVGSRLAALPAPGNGQVRAVPDERTIRYYGTIGLLDRPVAMRGRTALYGRRHLAQIVAIKRLQAVGKSLAEIQGAWDGLDDDALARMSGIAAPKAKGARKEFWRAEQTAVAPPSQPPPSPPSPPQPPTSIELRIELAPGAVLSLAVSERHPLSATDLRAIRAAAQPLILELARRPLATNDEGAAP